MEEALPRCRACVWFLIRLQTVGPGPLRDPLHVVCYRLVRKAKGGGGGAPDQGQRRGGGSGGGLGRRSRAMHVGEAAGHAGWVASVKTVMQQRATLVTAEKSSSHIFQRQSPSPTHAKFLGEEGEEVEVKDGQVHDRIHLRF